MKFLHLADLHIGKIVNSYNLLEDQRFALEGILALVDKREVNAVVLAGDLYDKSVPSAEAVSLFDWFLTELSTRSVEVLGVPGNHDSAERIAYAQGILEKQGIHFPPHFDGKVHSVTLFDEHGPVTFWLLPFLKPAQVRPFFPEADIQTDYTKALSCALTQCNMDPCMRNILIAHQFVTASGQSTQRTDSELNLGGVDNVDASIFDAFDYVALGHVHRAQRIGRDECRYAGSLLKYSFSESRFPKSAVLVSIDDKQPGDKAGACVSFELIDYPILRDLREIRGPLDELTKPEFANQPDASDYLHVTLTDSFERPDALARVRAVYPNVMILDRDTGTTRTRNDKAIAADIENLDPFKLFEDFFEQQTSKKLSDLQAELAHQTMESALQHDANGTEDKKEATR